MRLKERVRNVGSAPYGNTSQGRTMKLVAISRILDEADIIEAFIRHTAAFCCHHIILDNGSTDGTIEILKSLSQEGFPLSVYQNLSVSFSEQAFMTFMFKNAVTNHAADWVICLDGDEFIDDRLLDGGLNNFLDAERNKIDCIRLPWVQYQYTREDNSSEIIVPKRIIKCAPPVEDYKVIVNARLIAKNITIDNGGHGVLINGNKLSDAPILDRVRLAHYSERSPFQTVVKFTRGWVKAKAAGQLITSQNISWHYKGPFEILKQRPEDLLRSEWFMKYKNESSVLKTDPIDYRGGDLKYTPDIDAAMLAVRSLVGYLDALGERHGSLIDKFSEVRAYVEHNNRTHTQII